MPFKEATQPVLVPLETQDNNKEQPLNVVTTPPPLETAQPVVAAPAPAELPPPVPETRVVEVQPNTSFFGLSVGMYDPFSHSEKAASFNVEWQPGVKIAGFLQPLFGGMVTTNGAMLGYGGVGVPFNLTDRIFVMPSVAAGAYKHGGGYDIHSRFALRMGTEIAYQFDDKSRLGLNMHVLTGGTSFDRADRTEVIGLVYTQPFEFFSSSDMEPVQTTAPAAAPAPVSPAAAPAAAPVEPPAPSTVITP